MKDYYWLNQSSREFLSKDYLKSGMTPEKRIREIAEYAESILGVKGFADKFESYMAKGYFSLSTPIWTNFGANRGLPVSCFGTYFSDSIEDILLKNSEIGTMSKMGGGTSGYLGAIRPRGSSITNSGKADGPVRFLELMDKTTEIISQGSTRRGAFAAYLPVEHPDILEFLTIRSEDHPIKDMSIAVTITNKWMNEMIAGDELKQDIWCAIIKKRCETGYPYITFIDNANNNAPQVYKDKNYKIVASNLCNEIYLPSQKDESFVCVLSSLNLVHWDEIVKTDAIETIIFFLDAINEDFVRRTSGKLFMESAHNFAKNHRALGLGVLGWHSYLQKNMIAFESLDAKLKNTSIFRELRKKADAATQRLARLLGEAPILKGYGRRNTTTLAIAPTTSSSFILGQVSPGIEPEDSVYFIKNLAKLNNSYKNPYFAKLLDEKGKNNNDTWESILIHGGSVQHLDFLTVEEKDVFKTFSEISQKEIVIQAANRQKFIDQGQSLNLKIPPTASPKDISDLHIEGWRMGLKGFYYQRSSNPAQMLARNILSCKSCEA